MGQAVPFYLGNDGSLSVYVRGAFQVCGKDHPQYGVVLQALKDKADSRVIEELMDRVKAFRRSTHGLLDIVGDQILYKGQPVNNMVVQKVFALQEAGLPIQSLLNFLERLLKNPSYQSQQELYDFLAHQNLPITEDGYFLAYKGVLSNFMDKYSGKIFNGIGRTIEIERSQVDDNRNVGCSKGLHCGTIEYVKSYCTDKILIVKVDPADVVSVPHDCSCQKCRVSKYFVLSEYIGDLTAPVYSSCGNDYTPEDPEYYQDDNYGMDEYQDDEDDYEEEWEDDRFDDGDVNSY